MNRLNKFIVSERGQWDYPGYPTAVPTKNGIITMEGVPYPLFAIDETGYGGMIYPGGNYQFRGNMVYEIPMAQDGGTSPGPYISNLPKQINKPIPNLQPDKEVISDKLRISKRITEIQNKIAKGTNPLEFAELSREAGKLYQEFKSKYPNDNRTLAVLDYNTRTIAQESIEAPFKLPKLIKITDDLNDIKKYASDIDSVQTVQDEQLKWLNNQLEKKQSGGDISIPGLSNKGWLSKYQTGGVHQKIYTDPLEFAKANRAYNDSLDLSIKFPLPPKGYKIHPHEHSDTAGFVVGTDSEGNDIIEYRLNKRAPIEPIGYTKHLANKSGKNFNKTTGKYEEFFNTRRPIYKKPTEEPKLDQQAVMQQISKDYPGYSIKFEKDKIFIREPETEYMIDNGIHNIWQPLPTKKPKVKLIQSKAFTGFDRPEQELKSSTTKIGSTKTKPIMRSAQDTKTGQYQIGYNYWDDKSKSWKQKMFSKETQQENYDDVKIPRKKTIKVPPQFQNGGWLDKYQDGGSPEPMSWTEYLKYMGADDAELKNINPKDYLLWDEDKHTLLKDLDPEKAKNARAAKINFYDKSARHTPHESDLLKDAYASRRADLIDTYNLLYFNHDKQDYSGSPGNATKWENGEDVFYPGKFAIENEGNEYLTAQEILNRTKTNYSLPIQDYASQRIKNRPNYADTKIPYTIVYPRTLLMDYNNPSADFNAGIDSISDPRYTDVTENFYSDPPSARPMSFFPAPSYNYANAPKRYDEKGNEVISKYDVPNIKPNTYYDFPGSNTEMIYNEKLRLNDITKENIKNIKTIDPSGNIGDIDYNTLAAKRYVDDPWFYYGKERNDGDPYCVNCDKLSGSEHSQDNLFDYFKFKPQFPSSKSWWMKTYGLKPPRPVFLNQNYTKSGQVQIGWDVWDPERKQWKAEYFNSDEINQRREDVKVPKDGGQDVNFRTNVIHDLTPINKDKKSPPVKKKIAVPPGFQNGGWLHKYQDAGPVQRDPNVLMYPSVSGESDTFDAAYSLPTVNVTPKWTEAELERNRLRDDYIKKDKNAFRHWYDKLGYDRRNVDKRAMQYAYNKLAKEYLKGDRDKLTDEQKKFIGKSEYAARLQPTVGERFVEGITNPGFNWETLGNIAAPLEYPTNLVRGAVKGEFTDAAKGYTPSPYFVSSDLAGTSPTEAAIMSGIIDAGVDSGLGAIGELNLADDAARVGKYLTTQTPLQYTYKLNPKAKGSVFTPLEANMNYRYVNQAGYDDALKTFLVRANSIGDNSAFRRPTGFPSFSKGKPAQAFKNTDSTPHYLMQSDVPMYARGEINPVTGQKITGRHGAARPIDPETGETLTSMPLEDINTIYNARPNWLTGYERVWQSPKNIQGLGNLKLGENIAKSGFFNRGVYELPEYPGYLLKYEDTDLVKNTALHNIDDLNFADLQRNVNSPNVGKVIKHFKKQTHPEPMYAGQDMEGYVMRRMKGEPLATLGLDELENIPESAFVQYARDYDDLIQQKLAMDNKGLNVLYDPQDKVFRFIDLSPEANPDMNNFWVNYVIDNINSKMPRTEQIKTIKNAVLDQVDNNVNINIENAMKHIPKNFDLDYANGIRTHMESLGQAKKNRVKIELEKAGYKKYGGLVNKYQDGGDYNMQRALELGYTPDETGHWPSVDSETGMWLKSKKHPTAWMEYMYGQLDPEVAKAYTVIVNPEGYFGDDQLQYVSKYKKGGVKSSGEGYYDYINGYSGIFAKGGNVSKENNWLNKYK